MVRSTATHVVIPILVAFAGGVLVFEWTTRAAVSLTCNPSQVVLNGNDPMPEIQCSAAGGTGAFTWTIEDQPSWLSWVDQGNNRLLRGQFPAEVGSFASIRIRATSEQLSSAPVIIQIRRVAGEKPPDPQPPIPPVPPGDTPDGTDPNPPPPPVDPTPGENPGGNEISGTVTPGNPTGGSNGSAVPTTPGVGQQIERPLPAQPVIARVPGREVQMFTPEFNGNFVHQHVGKDIPGTLQIRASGAKWAQENHEEDLWSIPCNSQMQAEMTSPDGPRLTFHVNKPYTLTADAGTVQKAMDAWNALCKSASLAAYGVRPDEEVMVQDEGPNLLIRFRSKPGWIANLVVDVDHDGGADVEYLNDGGRNCAYAPPGMGRCGVSRQQISFGSYGSGEKARVVVDHRIPKAELTSSEPVLWATVTFADTRRGRLQAPFKIRVPFRMN